MSNFVINPYIVSPSLLPAEELLSQTSGTKWGGSGLNGGTICGKCWEVGASATTTASNSALGRELISFTVSLRKEGAGTGTLYAGVWSSSNVTSTPTTSFSGETNIANLTSSSGGAYYLYSGSHILQSGDTIGIVTTSGGPVMNIQTETAGTLPASQDITANLLWLAPAPPHWWNDGGYEPNGVCELGAET